MATSGGSRVKTFPIPMRGNETDTPIADIRLLAFVSDPHEG